MINRPMPETPEIVTPLFKQFSVDRSALTSSAIIGQGQVFPCVL